MKPFLVTLMALSWPVWKTGNEVCNQACMDQFDREAARAHRYCALHPKGQVLVLLPSTDRHVLPHNFPCALLKQEPIRRPKP
jgi:hypothetical protein